MDQAQPSHSGSPNQARPYQWHAQANAAQRCQRTPEITGRAAETLGVSAATLSRRMKAFEADLGRRLFLHRSDGYTLTSDGRALVQHTRSMEKARAQIDNWRGQVGRSGLCVCIRAAPDAIAGKLKQRP